MGAGMWSHAQDMMAVLCACFEVDRACYSRYTFQELVFTQSKHDNSDSQCWVLLPGLIKPFLNRGRAGQAGPRRTRCTLNHFDPNVYWVLSLDQGHIPGWNSQPLYTVRLAAIGSPPEAGRLT